MCSLYRKEFVDSYTDYLFNQSVHPMFEEFYNGFHKVCGGQVLQLFQPSELMAMVIGNTNYDCEELEKVRMQLQLTHMDRHTRGTLHFNSQFFFELYWRLLN